jgi:hypothetical protein
MEIPLSVYQPLEKYLKSQSFGEIPMTFDQIVAILGRALPKSAYDHRPWWANEAAGHSHAKAWLNAGFETAQVDMAQHKLVFRRVVPVSSPGGFSDWARDFRGKDAARTSLFGALKGTFSIETGFDLTKPVLDEAIDIDKTADLIDSGLRA